MAKLSKAQQERLQAQAQAKAEAQAKVKTEAQAQYRAAKEKQRLYQEQEAARIASLTSKQLALEEASRVAHEEYVRNVQIETAHLRSRPEKEQSYPYRPYVDEEE